jgi:hypothetical protein
MINLTDPPAAPAVRVDWIWTVSVERVLDRPPDLLSWANRPAARDKRTAAPPRRRRALPDAAAPRRAGQPPDRPGALPRAGPFGVFERRKIQIRSGA